MLKISAGTGESFQFAGLFPTLESNDLIHLVITSQLPTFAFSGFGPQPPWENDYLNWLEDPLLIDGASRCYRFGVKGIPEFEREHVINDYADVRHIFPSGHSVKGFLLAYGFDPIPEQFRQGTMAPGFAIVYDQFGREHRSPVELQAVRNRTPPRVLRKRNLLEHRDPIPRGERT